MPLYDLGCSCGYREDDAEMSVSDYVNAECPRCGEGLRSVKFPTCFVKRGGGWTPTMTGPERKRTRDEALGEALHTWKKNNKVQKAAKESKKNAEPIHYMT